MKMTAEMTNRILTAFRENGINAHTVFNWPNPQGKIWGYSKTDNILVVIEEGAESPVVMEFHHVPNLKTALAIVDGPNSVPDAQWWNIEDWLAGKVPDHFVL